MLFIRNLWWLLSQFFLLKMLSWHTFVIFMSRLNSGMDVLSITKDLLGSFAELAVDMEVLKVLIFRLNVLSRLLFFHGGRTNIGSHNLRQAEVAVN